MDRWEYLISHEYKIRHHICQYYLQDVLSIIDVGAYKYTIPWSNVNAIDPLETIFETKANVFHGTVSQWMNTPFYFNLEECGVMALGLEIEGDANEWDSFISLVNQSKITIIEYSKEHQPSVDQANKILQNTDKNIKTEMDFLFSEVDTIGFKQHAKRKMIVLERKN